MDQTITAVFESVDAASFAVRRITSHFGGVKQIRMRYRKLEDEHSHLPGNWIGVIPPGAAVSGQSGNGMYPGYAGAGISGTGYFFSPVSFYAEGGDFYKIGNQREGEPPEPRERMMIQITADTRNANRIAASLRSSGGWDVRLS